MNSVLLTIAIFISTVFLTSLSFATDQPPENCLKVNILNKTSYTCNRTDHTLKHGDWVIWREPPISLRPYGRDYWMGCQDDFYGPDMRATYECNGYSFSVRNQQNFCFLKTGNQRYSAYDVDKHLNVTNKQTQHAAFHNQKPGIAEITISLKKSP
ncbi:hypothetical protein [Candidatus Sororendozoicomonas aggregata]|uniref:hypothetical protein n=1 Tax=Candidatus Sororendozoicomonas aggregata TaxID=3073239 RepID=UPI002ED57ECD